MINNKINYIFFDLDGTLIDSVKDITFSINKMLNHFKKNDIDDNFTKSIIGKGFSNTIKKVMLVKFSDQEIKDYEKEAINLTKNYYEELIVHYTHLYPTVIQTLEYLKENKIVMGIVTNKEYQPTINILSKLNIIHFFDCIVGCDTTNFYKPHPAPLVYAMNKLNANMKNSIMVGDSLNDYLCAKFLRIECVLITHGYSNGIELNNFKNVLKIINCFNEIKNIV